MNCVHANEEDWAVKTHIELTASKVLQLASINSEQWIINNEDNNNNNNKSNGNGSIINNEGSNKNDVWTTTASLLMCLSYSSFS